MDVKIVEGAYKDLNVETADLVYVKDLVYLANLTNKKALQPFANATIASRVQPAMKGLNNEWVGLSFRARTIVYNPANVQASEVKSYEDLADGKFAARICLRAGKDAYNQALVATWIHHKGYEATKVLLTALMDNLAMDPYPNDTAMLEAIANGVCDVGISNSYYLANLLDKNPNFPVKIAFANQDTTGVHINGSGVGILKTSAKAEIAQQFVTMMLTDKYQLELSGLHNEFPAVVGLVPTGVIKNWGTFKTDATSWTVIGDQLPAAKQLTTEVGYN
ncbi:putative binding protein component of ABC iron transporter precursor [compost metagenome]